MSVNYNVVKYNKTHYNLWNNFVETSKNGTFLCHRDFMEYHADKFNDFSLLVFKNDKLVAICPANFFEQALYSHQGLTYGGLLIGEKEKLHVVLEAFRHILRYAVEQGFKTFYIKQLPSIYNALPADELGYLMYILKATLYRKDTLSVIRTAHKVKISSNRMEGVRRAKKYNLELRENDAYKVFWEQILIKNLKERFGVDPVHSIDEILSLKSKFPDKIRLFTVYKEDEMVAGTVIFETKHVAHSQYISATGDRNKIGSLDFLYHHLIEEVYKEKPYFDFGSSNTDSGKHINFGLQSWKEGFGARTVVQDFYKVDVTNHELLENVFV
jgi:hypothetical protein